MSSQRDIRSDAGGGLRWLIGGAVGGIVGSLLFGVLLWAVEPGTVAGAVPALYGLDPAGVVGWGLHLIHGFVLGVVFGAIVSREPVLGTLIAHVETDAIEAMGPTVRFALAGLVYGLAVWAILPLIALPIWLTVMGGDTDFPVFAVESVIGHMIVGLLLGTIFSIFVDVAPETHEAPFEEASESPRE